MKVIDGGVTAAKGFQAAAAAAANQLLPKEYGTV